MEIWEVWEVDGKIDALSEEREASGVPSSLLKKRAKTGHEKRSEIAVSGKAQKRFCGG
jgi:hypothetical protein